MIASDNPWFQCLYKTFWSWGFRKPLKNSESKYEGSPAPLYRNPDTLIMILFVILNLIILAIIIILYLNEVAIKDNEVERQGLFAGGIALSGINFLFFICVCLTDSASDQEWSRYLVIMILDFIGHLVYVAVGLYQVATETFTKTSVKGALIATLVLCILSTIGLAYMVFSIISKVYISNEYLAYYDEPQLQVSERLEFL
eukprot:TRINITY_DN4561_c0_g1_i1.p1 TRINITY_DN4561_c0_g1~~TRINITY_DN4561_c0_g1_i1.p1  ORF type:complete len:200 (-),score=41.16 TRINITY_DN4561_c0_g1_i1:187-786(-)